MKFVESDQYEIRYTSIDDVYFLRKWILDPTMNSHFAPKTEQEVFFFTKYWMSAMNKKSAITATFKGKPVGMGVLYLMFYQKLMHSAHSSIIVSPEYQRRGIGQSLLKNMMHLGKTYLNLELMQMEIYGETPIYKLLCKLGFEEVFRQEDFLKGSIERIFMEKAL